MAFDQPFKFSVDSSADRRIFYIPAFVNEFLMYPERGGMMRWVVSGVVAVAGELCTPVEYWFEVGPSEFLFNAPLDFPHVPETRMSFLGVEFPQSWRNSSFWVSWWIVHQECGESR